MQRAKPLSNCNHHVPLSICDWGVIQLVEGGTGVDDGVDGTDHQLSDDLMDREAMRVVTMVTMKTQNALVQGNFLSECSLTKSL